MQLLFNLLVIILFALVFIMLKNQHEINALQSDLNRTANYFLTKLTERLTKDIKGAVRKGEVQRKKKSDE